MVVVKVQRAKYFLMHTLELTMSTTYIRTLLEEMKMTEKSMTTDIAALDGVDERAGAYSDRLRSSCFLAFDDGTNDYGTAPLAADLITALLAQNAALRAEAQEMGAGMVTLSHEHSMERARANAAEAREERLRGELKDATEAKLDAISTLDAWFDRRKLGHDAVDQAVVDAASGYLRTSRVGGMPKAESDMILGVIQDMARLGLFADLFARAALTTGADHE